MEQYVPLVHSPAVNAMGLILQVVQPVLINTTLMVLAASRVCTNAFNVMMVLLVIDAIQHTMSMGLLNAHCAPSIVFHVFTTYLQPRPAVRLVKILMDSADILLTLARNMWGFACLLNSLRLPYRKLIRWVRWILWCRVWICLQQNWLRRSVLLWEWNHYGNYFACKRPLC